MNTYDKQSYTGGQGSAGGLLFIAGMALGALFTALYTPKSGKETRDTLKQKYEDMKNRGASIAEDVADKAEEGARKVSEKTGSLKQRFSRSHTDTGNEA